MEDHGSGVGRVLDPTITVWDLGHPAERCVRKITEADVASGALPGDGRAVPPSRDCTHNTYKVGGKQGAGCPFLFAPDEAMRHAPL